jgi:hypothetical protein
VGVAFLIGGPTPVAARTVSLVSFWAAAVAIYGASLHLSQRGREGAALVAGFLFITSPSLVEYASKSMLELPALLSLILALMAYFRVTNSHAPSPRAHVGLGLALGATYFVKSNYGVLLFLVIVTSALIEASFRPQRLLTRANFFIALPLLILFPIWFAYPPRLFETWRILVSQPFGVADRFSAAGLLFYPLAFFRISRSVWLGTLLLASLVIGFRFWNDRNVRFLILLVVIQIGLAQVHQNKVDRHIFPILPALFLLAGHELAWWWAARPTEKRRAPWWLLPGLVSTLVVAVSTYSFVNSLKPSSSSLEFGAIRRIAETIPRDEKTLLIAAWDLEDLTPPGLDWQLATDTKRLVPSQSGMTVNWEVVLQMARRLEGRGIPVWLNDKVARVLTHDERAATLRTVYLGLPAYASYSQSSDGLGAFLRAMAERYVFERVVVVTSVAPGSRYPLEFIDRPLRQTGWDRVARDRIQTATVRVDVYKRASRAVFRITR